MKIRHCHPTYKSKTAFTVTPMAYNLYNLPKTLLDPSVKEDIIQEQVNI